MKNKLTSEEINYIAQRQLWSREVPTTNFLLLYRAMLLNAIEGCLYHHIKIVPISDNMGYDKKIKLQKIQMEYEWDNMYIKSDVTNYPFSFINLCNYCNVDYDILRQKILDLVNRIEENKLTKSEVSKKLFIKPVKEYLLKEIV